MSADILKRLRAHRQFDAFLLRAIELLQAEGESLLRAEDLLRALAGQVASAPGPHEDIDSVFEMLVRPDARGFAGMSFLLFDARIQRARDKAKVMGLHFVVEGRVFDALRRGESAPLDAFYFVATEDLEIVARQLWEQQQGGSA